MRKEIRVWFMKTGSARYISHLDLNRCMSRAFHMAKLPLWYTEGFNPHVFLTFAAPLSLGFEGRRESMDIRLIEEMPYEELVEKLNAGLPRDIRAYKITEPVMKAGDIAFSEYRVIFETDEPEALAAELGALLALPELTVEKRTKKGKKQVDILPHFKGANFSVDEKGGLIMEVVLPAGSEGAINPSLFLEEAERRLGRELFNRVERIRLLNREKQEFF